MKIKGNNHVYNYNKKERGISLITLLLTAVVAIILLSVIVISLKNSDPSNRANEAVFRNDFVVLQNELTASKLNLKINNFEASEDINISMKSNEIYQWLPSLHGSSLEGKVEICNGQVVFIIPENDENKQKEERQWAEKLVGSEKVCDVACSETPKIFAPDISSLDPEDYSGKLSTKAVTLQITGGFYGNLEKYHYEYSLDKGETFKNVPKF